MKQIKKILIPNATGPSNIGDQAMLEVLIDRVRTYYPKANIVVHSTDPQLYSNTTYQLKPTLYHYIMFERTDWFNRIMRSWNFLIVLIKHKLGITSKSMLSNLLDDYQSADLIMYAPGGYLRSQPGFTEAANSILLLVHFWLGITSSGKTVLAPNSFGPFAHDWIKVLTAKTLSKFDLVSAREEYSHTVMRESGVANPLLSTDLALFQNKLTINKKQNSKPIIGFTLRKWLPPKEQSQFEQEFIRTMTAINLKKSVRYQPIVQVFGEKYGTIDTQICERIATRLGKKGIEVLPIVLATTVEEAKTAYAQLDVLVGMRMHSNILAATQGVPFIALAYEYKTQGIADQLGLGEYTLEVEKVTSKTLDELIDNCLKNKVQLKKSIYQNLKQLRHLDDQFWSSVRALADKIS